MKIAWRWVKEFVETDLSAQEAADRLINGGVEVASVTPLAPDLRGVVVGEVEAIERDLGTHRGHHVVVARVSTGRERYSVVCGAPNCAPGVRAAFAPPGAVLPGGRRIAATKIRGIRASVCHDTYTARQGVEHDDMNVLCLGARVIGVEVAVECLRAFLGASFSTEPRHRRRVGKVLALEATDGQISEADLARAAAEQVQ